MSNVAAQRTATRTLLVLAAFAAVGAIVMAVASPLTSTLAATVPFVYAAVAGVHSLLPFLASRLLGFKWAATAVGVFVGALSVGSTPLGILIVIPLMITGVVFDSVMMLLERSRVRGELAYLVAGLATAIALFFVSLPVMSPEKLGPVVIGLTLIGRVVGQLVAVVLSGVLARRIQSAGILPPPPQTPSA